MSLPPADRRSDAAETASHLEGQTPGASGHLARARSARQSGVSREALDHYREAQILDPDNAAAAVELALYLADLGRQRDAIEVLERCVRRHPELPDPRFHLGVLWAQLAEPAKATMQLKRSLALDPEDRLGVAAVLASLEQAGEELPTTYVRALFDQYADDFDRNLLKDLGYSAPAILRDAVNRCWRMPPGGDVLDLGCGTGLGGAAFRDVARRLIGVDLSPRMIEKAAARGIYDGLEIGDALAKLQTAIQCWDLIIAVDVLVYIGDLHPVFCAAAAALKTGGAFAVTVEGIDAERPMLKPTRRFGHPQGYLWQVAMTAGLRTALLETVSVRREKGQAVPGLAMVLIKDR